ncbi:MAG: rhomboid family intramembrane serine protease [Treponemataceae bacterium]|nr:rhomboid family intramembrane serine protease [Treponema sp.]MDE6068876.1 rhomboid family intramembrane serine protease [Treponemataceae bacterium]
MANILRKRLPYNFYYATIILAALNVLAFVFTGSGRSYEMTMKYGLQPILFVRGHCYWQIFTYMFMHGSWTHLISNMFGLLIFGTICERKIGSNEFLLFYILCGIVCGAFSLALYVLGGVWGVVLVGASGAVYSVLLLFSVIFPTSRVFIFGIVPVPAPLLVVIYAGISIFDEMFGRNQGVAHLTHLSGFAAAWIYCLARFGINPIKVWKNAWR